SNEEGGAANNAIDDNNDTMWQTAAAQLTSAQITFNITNTSTTHKIGKLDFRFGGDQSPDEFNISYSTDNSAYTNIFTNISDSGTNLTATLNFDAVTAQYIRFDFANPLNEFGIGGLHEFNVYTTDTLEEEYFIASDSIYFTVTPNLNESGDGYVIANSSNRLLIDDDQGDFNNGSCDSNCFVNETGIYLSEDNTSAYFTSQEFDTQRITPNLIRIIWNNTDQDGFNVSLQTRTSQDNITWNEWQGQGFLADENTLILLHFNNNLSGANNEIEQSNDSQSFANTKWQEGVLINGTASLAYNGTYINRSEGTISFWIKPNWTIENETVYLFDLAYNETYDRISLYIDNTTLIFRIRDAEDRDHQLNETINFTAEDLHNIIAVWNNSNMSLFIDNVSVPGTHISSEIKEEQNTLFLERFESAAYLESTGNVSGNYLAGKHDQGLMINETGHNANFSSTNNMNETLGTIEFWIRPEWNGNDGTQYYLFDTAQSATVNRISLIKDTDDWLRMAVYDTGGTLHTLSYNISNWTAQDFRSVAVNYNFSAAAMEMYINDELVNSTSETSFSVTLGTAIIIGNNRDLNAAANATIDSFRISDTVLNAFNYSYTDDTIPMNNTADYFSIGSDFNNLSQANSSFDEFAVYNISDKDSSEFYSTYYNESFLIPYPYYRYIQYRTLLQGDGNNFSSYLNRTIIEQENFEIVIKNFAPTNTSLESPENDTNITTPGVAFNWANSTDADNDIIYYDLEIATDAEFTSITNIIANISQGSNYSLLSDEELADGTYYWRVRAGDNFTVTQVDEINYSDYTEIQIFSIDSVFPLIFDESRNPAGTITEIEDVTFFVNVSELNIDTVWLSGNWTGSYENITLNVFDGNSTDRRYNYTVNSANWSVNEVIDWDFYINDTAGNENTTANDDDFTIQSSVDLNVSDIFTPSIVYSNSTTINISVGNDAAGTATDANVTCYADDTPIDSYLITLTGFETNTTGFCTYTFTFGNVTFNATVDP
ncbi:discoidin domain-containing protein, partial [Candidatus Woesearchaeota archaeon]|nr:discoidin domain-containing protein [Candidatus Woesearchaeota archaeon]